MKGVRRGGLRLCQGCRRDGMGWFTLFSRASRRRGGLRLSGRTATATFQPLYVLHSELCPSYLAMKAGRRLHDHKPSRPRYTARKHHQRLLPLFQHACGSTVWIPSTRFAHGETGCVSNTFYTPRWANETHLTKTSVDAGTNESVCPVITSSILTDHSLGRAA